REVFADLHACDVGVDRIEFAAELFRGIGLEVIHVHVGRTARQVNHDRRFLRLAGLLLGSSACGVQPQHVCECEASTKCPNLEEIATRDAITEPIRRAEEPQHDLTLERTQKSRWDTTPGTDWLVFLSLCHRVRWLLVGTERASLNRIFTPGDD